MKLTLISCFVSPLALSSLGFGVVASNNIGTIRGGSEGHDIEERALGFDCASDANCGEGRYCHDTICWDGSPGDRCLNDNDCQEGLVCQGVPGAYIADGHFLPTCNTPSEAGVPCARDEGCIGYCNNGLCWDGVEGDSCAGDSDCQGSLTCVGTLAFKTCRDQRPEGGVCGADADCLGYCHNLRCWDGSDGDDCGSDSDCQSGLTCFGVGMGKKCTSKKGEGARCGADADCLGYCQHLRCYDGSRGDPCKHNSDCQSNRCEKRCRICAQKKCK